MVMRGFCRAALAGAIVCPLLTWFATPTGATLVGVFVPAAPMSVAREDASATTLRDGTVLVVGAPISITGTGPGAETYDPATNLWTPTGPVVQPRFGATATLLSNGRVLVAGGDTNTAEVYDPATRTWAATGSMFLARSRHSATLLRDGRVLVAGGSTYFPSNTAEIWDPSTGVWTTTGSMSDFRGLHTATRLPDGRVLVAGGFYDTNMGVPVLLSSAEIFNPATGTWARTGSMSNARVRHIAELVPNGMVLVAGGDSTTGATTELYNPALGLWSPGTPMTQGRAGAVAALLHASLTDKLGAVFVAGGFDSAGNPEASAEIYHVASGSWTPAGDMSVPRQDHSAALLRSGQVLIVGGQTAGNVSLATAERFVPLL
jgi:hypothetical protein